MTLTVNDLSVYMVDKQTKVIEKPSE